MADLLIALQDVKSGLWYTPMNVRTEAEAVRVFGEALRDPKGLVGAYPQDFVLYRIGTYDSTAGRIVAEDPSIVITGEALVRRLSQIPEQANGFGRHSQMDSEEEVKNAVPQS